MVPIRDETSQKTTLFQNSKSKLSPDVRRNVQNIIRHVRPND